MSCNIVGYHAILHHLLPNFREIFSLSCAVMRCHTTLHNIAWQLICPNCRPLFQEININRSKMSWSGPEKVIWFLPGRKSIIHAYSQHQEKLRKFLQKYGLGSSFPLDIIFISANHVMNTSSLTQEHLPYSRNLPILLHFCVFGVPSSQRRCYAAMLSQALVIYSVIWPLCLKYDRLILLY